MSRRGRRLPRSFYARPARTVAVELLNKVMVGPDGRAGRIVEVEAYCGADDPGSHAYRGPTPRTEVMFGRAGHLYVYFTYGMHWCSNVVTDDVGTAGAVLIRALTPLRRIHEMREARPAARRDRDLARGPARLTAALGIDGSYDGTDLTAPNPSVFIADDGEPPPTDAVQTVRVGLTHGADLPWRWYVPGVPEVSKP